MKASPVVMLSCLMAGKGYDPVVSRMSRVRGMPAIWYCPLCISSTVALYSDTNSSYRNLKCEEEFVSNCAQLDEV